MGEPKSNLAAAAEKPTWRMPTLTEDSIAEITHDYTSSGLDGYEATNPSVYGS